MTTDLTSRTTHSTSTRSLSLTTALATFSGAALVIDTVTVAVLNRSFDPLDSILFLGGFVGMLLTVGALSTYLSRNRRGGTRLLSALGFYVAVAAALGALSFAFDEFGRHTFSSANKGLHGEWSFFSIGVTLLLIAGWSARRRQDH